MLKKYLILILFPFFNTILCMESKQLTKQFKHFDELNAEIQCIIISHLLNTQSLKEIFSNISNLTLTNRNINNLVNNTIFLKKVFEEFFKDFNEADIKYLIYENMGIFKLDTEKKINNSAAFVKALLLSNRFEDIKIKDIIGETFLSYVVRLMKVDLVKLSINLGINVNDNSDLGQSALSIICNYGLDVCRKKEDKIKERIEIARLLIDSGANVNDNKGGHIAHRPVIHACRQGYTEIVKILLEKDIDVNAADDERYTPLMFACQNGDIEIAELLIKKGAKIDTSCYPYEAKFQRGYTALTFSIIKENAEIVKLLIKHKATISKQALELAASAIQSSDKILELLLNLSNEVDVDYYRALYKQSHIMQASKNS